MFQSVSAVRQKWFGIVSKPDKSFLDSLQRPLEEYDFNSIVLVVAMFKKLFSRATDAFHETEQQTVIDADLQERMRKTGGSNSAELAAVLLVAPDAMMRLTLEEARIVVSYMEPRKFAEGTVIIQEGDKDNTDYMVLVLDGEVTVESIAVSRITPVTNAALGHLHRHQRRARRHLLTR
jgi:hypothetical protein